MIALFDSGADLVGWMDPGKNIFDTDMNWVAYIRNGHAWSTESGDWLGPVNGLACLDTNGKPVAWAREQQVQGTLAPLRPLRPLRPLAPLRPLRPLTPLRPLKPLTPLGGWSDQDWMTWVGMQNN